MKIELRWDAGRFREETVALRRLCDGIDDGSVLIAADVADTSAIATRLVAARRAGTRVALFPHLDDPGQKTLSNIAAAIAVQPDVEARMRYASVLASGTLKVNDKTYDELTALSTELTDDLRLICKLADVVVFGSFAQQRRWERMTKASFPCYVLAPEAPAPGRQTGESIVVYAPSTLRAELSAYVLAFERIRRPVRFVSAENPDDTLSGAAVVVCTDWDRPLVATALAAAGHRVVAPVACGLPELGAGYAFAPLDFASLREAVDVALSDERPIVPLADSGPLGERLTAKTARTERPLVSIVVRTFDRPSLLARALESLVAQEYRPLETIVVNGGGPDVRELVERFSDRLTVRYVAASHRTKISESSNLGIRAAAGKYVGYLDDDDLLYPDHVRRAVDVLERTGAVAAYANCAGEYVDIVDEVSHLIGYTMFLDRPFSQDDLLVRNVAPIHSIVHRRDAAVALGLFDEAFSVCDDWELWIRLAESGDFVHIDRVTCEYSWRFREGSGNMTISHQRQFAAAHAAIYARYAQRAAGRTTLQNQQAELVALLERRAAAIESNPGVARELLLPPRFAKARNPAAAPV